MRVFLEQSQQRDHRSSGWHGWQDQHLDGDIFIMGVGGIVGEIFDSIEKEIISVCIATVDLVPS